MSHVDDLFYKRMMYSANKPVYVNVPEKCESSTQCWLNDGQASINSHNTELFFVETMENKALKKKLTLKMSQLALSCSFEYLCYGSTAILNILNSFSAGTVFKRQNLTSDSDV